MSNISNRSFLYFLVFSLLSFILVSCGDKKDDPQPENLPDRPVISWKDLAPADKIFYTDEAVVLQANKTGGYLKTVEWKINGTLVTNSQEIIFNDDSTLISLSHPFNNPGRYDVSLRVANEGGEAILIQVLNFEVRPTPKIDLLTGQVSKKWKFTSIKLGADGAELIKNHEKDNTLTFFRETQNEGTTTYNCVFDGGTIRNGELDTKGRWEFVANDRYLKFFRVDVFPNNARIIELTPTTMILGRNEGNSEVIYKFALVP
ncbi:lipocalin family protein [Bernardetia sp. Wsw4-3y2]|uniref:lipocalin family protein n=1 Tax=Bernardetia sp. Wsw4-3y2 TaxID=3127471 RepID=UPI0030D45C11